MGENDSMTLTDKLQSSPPSRELPKCSDFDDDCDDIPDKVYCWLYDPAKGMCPFLKARAE